jgi:hypothetical protein
VGAVARSGFGFFAAGLLLFLLLKKKRKGEAVPDEREATEEELTTKLGEPPEFRSEYGFSGGHGSMGSDDLDYSGDVPRDGMIEDDSNEWDFAPDGNEGI